MATMCIKWSANHCSLTCSPTSTVIKVVHTLPPSGNPITPLFPGGAILMGETVKVQQSRAVNQLVWNVGMIGARRLPLLCAGLWLRSSPHRRRRWINCIAAVSLVFEPSSNVPNTFLAVTTDPAPRHAAWQSCGRHGATIALLLTCTAVTGLNLRVGRRRSPSRQKVPWARPAARKTRLTSSRPEMRADRPFSGRKGPM